MTQLSSLLVLLGLLGAAAGANATSISRESKLFAECEFIYSYTAQLLQLQNNSGGAINVLRRSSILTTANMMSNAENGMIPGWKVKVWAEVRPSLKTLLDSNKVDALTEAARCDREAMPLALKVRDRNLLLWGQDFDSLQHEFLARLRLSTGI